MNNMNQRKSKPSTIFGSSWWNLGISIFCRHSNYDVSNKFIVKYGKYLKALFVIGRKSCPPNTKLLLFCRRSALIDG